VSPQKIFKIALNSGIEKVMASLAGHSPV